MSSISLPDDVSMLLFLMSLIYMVYVFAVWSCLMQLIPPEMDHDKTRSNKSLCKLPMKVTAKVFASNLRQGSISVCQSSA